MKTIVSTLALLTSVCLGAELTPPPNPTPEPPENAAPEVVVRAETWSDDGLSLAFNPPGHTSAQPLVVGAGNLAPEKLANLQEDLAVMNRILNKTVERETGREGRDSAMGIVLSALPGSRGPQSLYLEGYGALFFVNVKFPLVPALGKEEEKSDTAADTTWETTKRELYGQKSGTVRLFNVDPARESLAPYNAEQVENLKKEILETLKNASNIRDLKPDEFVTVTVIGSRSGPVTRLKHVISRNSGSARRAEIHVAPGASRGTSRESVLTVRARKSDVDAFAKESIDLAEFTKRASVATY